MSRTLRLLAGTAVVLAGMSTAQAQDFKFSGLVQVWYTQMLDSNLRNNSVANYYNLRGEYKENGFSVRRTEIKVAGKILDGVKFEVMLDPSIATSTTNPMILQDAAIEFELAPGLDFKVGQFKTLQTMEGLTSSSEILFAERSQLGRAFGDKRDRGGVLSYSFGDPKAFGAKISAAAFNGVSDAVSGKSNDTNAGKDAVVRLDMNVGKEHKFGVYTLQGTTDVTDKTGVSIAPAAPPAGWPNQAAIYDNKDKTQNIGAFYEFQNDSLILNGEYIVGTLGRRNPTLAAATPAVKREHLDQKFLGYYVTAGYKMGSHTLLARYDVLNYNSGDDWYTATSPYVSATTDYTPKFTEIVLGYTYAFKSDKVKAANIKVNYINRSKNFLKPNALTLQTKEQGGDTLMVGFQVAF
ncbi:MAG: porin [Holophaga sp.]